jgi:hypothetical protein
VDAIELVQDLIDKIKNLPHRNEEELDALKRKAEMRIRKIYILAHIGLAWRKKFMMKVGWKVKVKY